MIFYPVIIDLLSITNPVPDRDACKRKIPELLFLDINFLLLSLPILILSLQVLS